MTIEVIEFIQSLGNGFFDFFFNMISFLGEEYVYIVVMGIIYYAYKKELGEFLAFSLFTTAGINTIIKGIVSAPRPFEKYPTRVENLRPDTAGGHSFPSGHTQNFTTFLFAESFYVGKQRMFIVSGVLSVLMALSRMYLGVHFLEDVTVAMILGVLLAYIFYRVFTKFQENKVILHKIYLVVLLFMTPFLFFIVEKDFYTSYGLLLGFVLAMMFEKKYVQFSMDVTLKQKLLRVLLGLIIMMSIQIGTKPLFQLFADDGTILMNIFDLTRYGLVSLLGLGIFPLTFKKFKY